MGFSENLKKIRESRRLSQEELAELLGVSRQAVSKWEQGMGYPEVEKLLLLSHKLNISLDELMFSEISSGTRADEAKVTGTIVITSPHENIIATCYKIMTSRKMRGGKNAPKYALFGIGKAGSSFLGEPTTFLGWYADQKLLSKELEQIREAIVNGVAVYTLQYSAKTRRRLASVQIIEN